jgi:hypothetical protein
LASFFFKCPARDFHCGLRGFTKAAFEKMELQTTGMEFASEMVIKATLKQIKITEVPITLAQGRALASAALETVARRLAASALHADLFAALAVSGAGTVVLSAGGIILAAALSFNNIRVGGIELNVGTLAMACMAIVVGFQLVAFAFYTKVFAIAEGLLPEDPKLARVFKVFTLEKGIVTGLLDIARGHRPVFARAVDLEAELTTACCRPWRTICGG